jgi:hypothetical protein
MLTLGTLGSRYGNNPKQVIGVTPALLPEFPQEEKNRLHKNASAPVDA